ncbi:MAG TPA: toll/interleukin-1 receptor domain-containing protein [Terrimicrobiaceae bacterium]
MITVLQCTAAFEAEIWSQILSWNGVNAVVSRDRASTRFLVGVIDKDRQAAEAILELSGNKPPSYPDRFAFVSHTASDMPFIEKHVAPILKTRRIDFILLNYTRFPREYAQFIVRALSNSGWVLIILSCAAAQSNWVKFEVDWAIRNKDSRHIIPIVIDVVDPRDIDLRLVTFPCLDFRAACPEAERRLLELLPEIGLRERLLG